MIAFDQVLDLLNLPTWDGGRALCADYDPEMFFPGKGGTARPAKRICAECPVQAACLRFALDNDEHHGVWGGLSERERRRLRRRRAA